MPSSLDKKLTYGYEPGLRELGQARGGYRRSCPNGPARVDRHHLNPYQRYHVGGYATLSAHTRLSAQSGIDLAPGTVVWVAFGT